MVKHGGIEPTSETAIGIYAALTWPQYLHIILLNLSFCFQLYFLQISCHYR